MLITYIAIIFEIVKSSILLNQVDDYVRIAHIDQMVVEEFNRTINFEEASASDSQVLDEVFL
jgi:hypothetical protein